MNFKKVLILGLLISSILAIDSNDNPEDDHDDDEISSDEDDDGKSNL